MAAPAVLSALLEIPYPRISPVAVRIGPIAIRWYGLMYVAGYIVGQRVALWRLRQGQAGITAAQLDVLVIYLVGGMFLGARLVYVLVYDFPAYRAHPLSVFAVWQGGLSFHGAALGFAAACWLFARRHKAELLRVTDTVSLAAPPGLFLGRIGNFINGELYGRPSSVPWAMVFPTDPQRLPRHPSQLYEALAEGVVLFLVLLWVDRRSVRRGWARPGGLTGAFLVGYATIRFALEFTRQPDAQLGFIAGPFSMGQLLSAAMLLVGALVIARAYRSSSG